MHWVHDPEERDKKCAQRPDRIIALVQLRRPEGGKELFQQQIKQQTARDVEEEIGQMKAIEIAVPKKIIDDEGEILHGPIMRGVGIEKEMMTKRFEDKKRTLHERVISNKIYIVPNHLALKRRQTHDESHQGENHEAGPLFAADPDVGRAQISANSGDQANSRHKSGRSVRPYQTEERPPG